MFEKPSTTDSRGTYKNTHTLMCLADPDCTTCCTVHDKYTRLDRVWHQRGCGLFSTGDNHARNMDFCPGTARHLRLMLPWNALCCNLLQRNHLFPSLCHGNSEQREISTEGGWRIRNGVKKGQGTGVKSGEWEGREWNRDKLTQQEYFLARI